MTPRHVGDVIVRRDLHLGRVKYAAALEVVHAGAREVIAAQVPGSETRRITLELDGLRMTELRRIYIDGEWTVDAYPWNSTVALHRVASGRPYNLVQFHDPESFAFLCWYVNFERPIEWRPRGYDTLDYLLDLVVLPDRTFQWKDVDEWEWALAQDA